MNKLLEALKAITQCCDGNEPAHRQFYYIAKDAIDEHESEVKKLNLLDVSRQSELFSCPECCSGDVYKAINEDKYLCLECKHEWATE